MGDSRKTPFYTLPGFKQPPRKFIVTEKSKELYAKGNSKQGFVGVAWKGKDKNGDEVVYIELVPGFNQFHTEEKGYKRANKDGEPYVIYNSKSDKKYDEKDYDNMAVDAPVYSNLIHIEAIDMLKKSGRIPNDVPRENMFGFGVFVDDHEDFLIGEFRVTSFSINSESVKYNREYFLTQYYADPDVNLHQISKEQIINKAQGFKLQRPLPVDLSQLILNTLLRDLNRGDSNNRTCKNNIAVNERQSKKSEKWWDLYQNDPIVKNTALMNTLFTCIRIEENEEKRNNLVKEILGYIKANELVLISQDKKEQFLDLPIYDGKTCLQLAVENGQTRVVEQLLKAGATYKQKDYLKKNPLLTAIEKNNIPIIKLLLENSKESKEPFLNEVDQLNGMTPLLYAASQGRIEAMQVLIEYKADLNSRTKNGASILTIENKRGTPFENAMSKGNLEMVKLLVEQRADIYSGRPVGDSLFMAVAAGHTAIIQYFLEQEKLSDSLKSTDPWKHHIHKIMLIKATRNGHDEIVRLLLNFIDFDKSSLSLSLLEAIRLGYPAIVNNLLEKKADLEVRNKDNNTPLMYVAKFEESLPEQIDVSPDEDAAQDLLEDEKPKNYPKKKSKISNNHEKIAKNLLEHEAQVNSINDKGETALMLAARAGKKDFVELLLDYNADPNLRNMNNQSALEIAQEKGHKDLVILLSSFPLPKVQEESIIENREEEIATQQEPQNEVPIEPIAENVLEEESSTELINLVSSSSEEWKDLASTVSLSEDENSEIDSELFSYSPEILAEVPNQLPFSEEVDNEMKEEPKAKPKETRQADESINDVTDYFNQDSGSPSIFISNDIVQVTSKSITVAEVKKTTTDDEVDEVIKELEKVDKDKNEGLRSKETKVVPPPKTIVKRTLLDSIAAHATLWSMVGFSLGGIAGGVIAVLGAGPTLGLSFLAAFPLFLFTAGVGFIIGGLIGGIVGAVMHVPQPQPSDKVIEKNAAERKIDESVSSKNKSRNSYANQLSAVLEKKSTEKIPSSPPSTTLTKNYNNPIHTKIKKEPTQVKKIVGSRRNS